jgi:protein-glutamine gamma-glutamyltransferase
MPWLNTMRLRLDALEYNWNRWVISYDSDLQMQLLKDMFGENERQRALFALIGLMALSLAALAAFMVWRRRRIPLDPHLALYLEFTDALAAKGLGRLPAEGPLTYCERVGCDRPELKTDMHKITGQFIRILYSQAQQAGTVRSGPAGAEPVVADDMFRLRNQVRLFIIKLLD